MTKFNAVKIFVLAVIFSVAIGSTAFAGRQDFVLKNHTGRDIVNIYVTPSNSYYWNDDILGVDILYNGDEIDIFFDRSETARYWDMKANFSDGSEYIWEDIDLLRVSVITLRFDGAAVER